MQVTRTDKPSLDKPKPNVRLEYDVDEAVETLVESGLEWSANEDEVEAMNTDLYDSNYNDGDVFFNTSQSQKARSGLTASSMQQPSTGLPSTVGTELASSPVHHTESRHKLHILGFDKKIENGCLLWIDIICIW